MTKILNSTYGHHCPTVEKTTERALFAKTICNSYADAVALLKARNLGPGEIAVVRYYINDSASHWDDTIGLPVRMVLGVGGANAQSDDDIYIFNDSRIDGNDYVTADDVETLLIELLQGYVSKSDLEKILNSDKEWKELVNNSFNENTNDHENFSRDIDELRQKIDNIQTPDINLSNYYTKSEIDKLFDEIEIPEINLSEYFTKSEITEILEEYVTNETLLQELDNKADSSEITEITEILETKVDSSYVENYFVTNVENTVNQIIQDKDIPGIVEEEIANQNINQQVSDAVDKKLENFEGVTTENIDDALQNNEYFTTNVITPITRLETTVKELVDASVDGGEMEEWV